MDISIEELTAEQLREAAEIKENIASLEERLAAILGGTAAPARKKKRRGKKRGRPPGRPKVAGKKKKRRGKKKRKMSAKGRAAIAAAQRKRWAKLKAKG